MAQRGLCSRREADEMIAQGLVRVNGELIKELGSKVMPDVKIEVSAQGKRRLEAKVTILLNKPKGYVSSQPEKGYRSAVELVTRANQEAGDQKPFSPQMLKGLAPAGRLDIDSQGLLVLTQDGVIAKKLIGQDSQIEKEYIVRVSGQMNPGGLERLQNGSLTIDGRRLKRARVEWINDDQLRFVLTEGLKRQVRKMCEAVGLKVMGLKRVRIGKVALGRLPEGRWRLLHRDEEF
jgi:23S rRNA pseudouridine2604 synthase